jgi:hypothetical protein
MKKKTTDKRKKKVNKNKNKNKNKNTNINKINIQTGGGGGNIPVPIPYQSNTTPLPAFYSLGVGQQLLPNPDPNINNVLQREPVKEYNTLGEKPIDIAKIKTGQQKNIEKIKEMSERLQMRSNDTNILKIPKTLVEVYGDSDNESYISPFVREPTLSRFNNDILTSSSIIKIPRRKNIEINEAKKMSLEDKYPAGKVKK